MSSILFSTAILCATSCSQEAECPCEEVRGYAYDAENNCVKTAVPQVGVGCLEDNCSGDAQTAFNCYVSADRGTLVIASYGGRPESGLLDRGWSRCSAAGVDTDSLGYTPPRVCGTFDPDMGMTSDAGRVDAD